eukprot:TRINITY_DN2841_c0_g1_i1.p1 TRINITY_DN2841_c0_g1~~TRINITY_DN2841_c0_g1_i1.p1  ORF type:complete len:248 (-),score=72.67 TRINITY_DN2841_c0_g1_i1:233-976(-)
MSQGKIIYCMIARKDFDHSVLMAEYSLKEGNFITVSKQILSKVQGDVKKIYAYENYLFHLIIKNGLAFLCMSEKEFGSTVPYSLLEEIQNRFYNQYKESWRNARENEFKDFSRVLSDLIDKYSIKENVDKISKIKSDINRVENVMKDNIEKVIKRGESIDILLSKSEDLENSSQNFKFNARALKRKMWWKNQKLCCVIWLFVIIIIAAIVALLLWHFGIFDHHNSTTTSTTGNFTQNALLGTTTGAV